MDPSAHALSGGYLNRNGAFYQFEKSGHEILQNACELGILSGGLPERAQKGGPDRFFLIPREGGGPMSNIHSGTSGAIP